METVSTSGGLDRGGALGAGVAVIDDPAVPRYSTDCFSPCLQRWRWGEQGLVHHPRRLFLHPIALRVDGERAGGVRRGSPTCPGHREELNASLVLCERDKCRLTGLGRQSQASPNVTFDFAPDPARTLAPSSARRGDRQAPVRRVVFLRGGHAPSGALRFTDPLPTPVSGWPRATAARSPRTRQRDRRYRDHGAESHRLSAAWELGEETTSSASGRIRATGLCRSRDLGGDQWSDLTTTTTVGPTTTTLGTKARRLDRVLHDGTDL